MSLPFSKLLREYVVWAKQQSAPAQDVKSWAESVGWLNIQTMFEKDGTASWSISFEEHSTRQLRLPFGSQDDLENVE